MPTFPHNTSQAGPVQHKKDFLRRPFALLAAVLLMVVLVGSLTLLVYAASQHIQTGNGNPRTQPTTAPTIPQQRGQTLYTTPSNQVGFDALSWSPDSLCNHRRRSDLGCDQRATPVPQRHFPTVFQHLSEHFPQHVVDILGAYIRAWDW